MKRKIISAAAIAALSVGATAAPALAQQAAAQPQAAQQQAPQVEVTDEELQTFVTAALAMQQAAPEWQAKLQGAADQAEAQKVQQEAQAALKAEIEKTGMAPERYNQIGMAAQADPELQARIGEKAKEMGVAPQGQAQGQAQEQ